MRIYYYCIAIVYRYYCYYDAGATLLNMILVLLLRGVDEFEYYRFGSATRTSIFKLDNILARYSLLLYNTVVFCLTNQNRFSRISEQVVLILLFQRDFTVEIYQSFS